jgi:hypothetical protein
MSPDDQGASASRPGSTRFAPEAPTGLRPSGDDPSRKVWPLCGYAPGHYFCRCAHCGKQFQGDKRALSCLECAVASARFLMELGRTQHRAWTEWYSSRRVALDELIKAAAVFWGAGSEQHNLIRDVADAAWKSPPSVSDGIAERRDAASGSIGEADDSAGPKGIAKPVSPQSASLQEREGK